MFIGFVAEGEADFVQNSIPKPEVWTNVVTEGYVRKSFPPKYEVWTNVGTEGGSSDTLAKKNSRIDYPTLYFFGEKI